MKTSIYILISLLVLTHLFTACSDDSKNDIFTEPDLHKLGEFTDQGMTVAAYAKTPLAVGYHELFIEVHENGVRLDDIQINMTPMMHMENHMHASPYQMPAHVRDATYGLFPGWAIFTMPSGMMGTWELQFTVYDQTGETVIAAGDIEIGVDESNRVRTFMLDNGSRYVFTWIQPLTPIVGLNDLKVALHKRESMMHFPPVLNQEMEFEPWMPSMDHGSSNNEVPTHSGDGFYDGKVNFNMTGDWELRFEMTIDGENVDVVFELEF